MSRAPFRVVNGPGRALENQARPSPDPLSKARAGTGPGSRTKSDQKARLTKSTYSYVILLL